MGLKRQVQLAGPFFANQPILNMGQLNTSPGGSETVFTESHFCLGFPAIAIPALSPAGLSRRCRGALAMLCCPPRPSGPA